MKDKKKSATEKLDSISAMVQDTQGATRSNIVRAGSCRIVSWHLASNPSLRLQAQQLSTIGYCVLRNGCVCLLKCSANQRLCKRHGRDVVKDAHRVHRPCLPSGPNVL
eukprot:2628555-Amphidinium_carterae.1